MEGDIGDIAYCPYVVFVYEKADEPGKVIVDEAIEFFAQRTSEQPVFMYLAFSNPHDPRVAHERFRRQYEPAEIPLPKNYLPVHPFDLFP